MEMRGREDIEIGQDLTPPLSPLFCSLHANFISTHCSSCFSPLSNHSSPLCSSAHFSSDELCSLSTAELRVAFRLLLSLPSHPLPLAPRIFGLLTNHRKFITFSDNDDDMYNQIRDGATAIASVRKLRNGKEHDDVLREEEAAAVALCLVLTNAVEVHDDEGRNLGIAVYDFNFSFINHSCSPNSCYSFLISPPPRTSSPFPNQKLLIVPATTTTNEKQTEFAHTNLRFAKGDYDNYGPKIIVRSIKKIKKHEEITVTYTDLLQPKAIRRSELWAKYRFHCGCARCSASLPSYVDRALQEISTSNLSSSSACADQSFCIDEATEKLIAYVDEVITEFLSDSDPESCCKKLESVLILGLLDETFEKKQGISQLKITLHPLHHLALSAYVTLASAYRIRASDILTVHTETTEHQLGVFDMFRTGSAYSFFLAATTYHLFCFESSLIASVANIWTNAGESLITLARSSVWDSFAQPESSLGLKLFSLGKHNCSKCSSIDKFEAILSFGQGPNEDFENMSIKFINCITNFSQKVWGYLNEGCNYLKMFKDPMDFRELGTLSTTVSDYDRNVFRHDRVSDCRNEDGISGLDAKFCKQKRINIFELGVHCLLYGELLASICCGKHSQRTRRIQSVIYCEEENE
ncbi:protein SET DOMAIN GROUP 41 [Mercurialis annua]|uniref:protein SET DOMAIN GROUP 41 n=1 Tax=Mercurialis annua TaxID=3986 RepID=UPI00215E927E|nr:protein SET DOMAIN GROUP 41 [Mercurialis annua]